MITVILESPYRGNIQRNTAYVHACMRDCISRGESPMAGHMLFTQVLDDKDALERDLGIACHTAWIRKADKMVVYEDLGITPGMEEAIKLAQTAGVPIVLRRLDGEKLWQK